MSATRGGKDQISEKRAVFSDFIGRQKLKSTRQRNLVADVFFASDSHLSIEEILQLVRRKDPAIGYATVYRTLKLLAQAGLADERHFSDGIARFEQSMGHAHHDHMVCTICGRVFEFANDQIERLQESIARDFGFEITSHKLELYGICKDCQSKKQSQRAGRAKA